MPACGSRRFWGACEMNPHRAHPVSPAAIVRSAIVNRQLIGQLVRSDVVSRYRGSLMGIAWSFLNPLLMLAVYTIVFSRIFHAEWPGVPRNSTARAEIMPRHSCPSMA